MSAYNMHYFKVEKNMMMLTQQRVKNGYHYVPSNKLRCRDGDGIHAVKKKDASLQYLSTYE